jgi:hypothetical protein
MVALSGFWIFGRRIEAGEDARGRELANEVGIGSLQELEEGE